MAFVLKLKDMNFAPALSTIITPKYVSEFTIKQYGLATDAKTSILKTGINHVYLIETSNEKFVFRICFLDWRTEKEIQEELKLLDFLKENNISVAYPIKDKHNNYIQQINAFEGNRLAVLFSYAEGTTVRQPSEKVCYNFGIAMAKMHQKLVGKTIKKQVYSADTLVGFATEEVEKRFSKQSNELSYFKRAYQVLSKEFEKIDTTKVRKGIVHLDLWYENMKVKDETEITFFDFDNCGNGWLFLDIGYSLMLFYRNDPNEERFLARKSSFYKGYESITPISNEEKRLAPYGGLAIWLYYSGQQNARFNDFANHFMSEEFLKYWVHTVNQWMLFNKIEI